MLGQLNAALASLAAFAEPLTWVVIALFALAVALEYVDREYARALYVLSWVVFGAFWLTLVQPFFVEDQSFIRGIGAVVAVPLSLLVAKVFYEGRDSLFTLSRAVAVMALIYAPFLLFEPLREQAIMIVTGHTALAMDLVGYSPPLVTELSDAAGQVPAGQDPDLTREISGKEQPYENTFVFFSKDVTITYSIILSCTGIGSMAVVVGLIAAVGADVRRKLQAIALSVGIIYVLNIVRNVSIAIFYGHQYAHVFPELTMTVFGLDNPLRVSYIWIDRIAAQSLAVVAMLLIIWLVVRIVPEVMQPIEDVLYLLTGEEHDLAGALNLDDDAEPAD